MKVVGLDLSLTATGLAVVGTGGIAACTTIGSTGKADATLAQRSDRLTRLARSLMAEIAALRPDLVVIEQPAFSKVQGHAHDRSGLWWLVVADLMGLVPTVEVTPGSLKKYATGKGTASKDTVLAHAVRRYASVPISNNNEADATVLAAMGARHLGEPIEASLPINHVDAMPGVKWPTKEGITA